VILKDLTEEEQRNTLSRVLKANFDKNKIKDLDMPSKPEGFIDNKFVRDKTGITLGMSNLQNQIYMEIKNDKKKLSACVFDDFEKQTSWQSYTTLLITDIVNDNPNEKREQAGKTGSSFGGVKKTSTKLPQSPIKK